MKKILFLPFLFLIFVACNSNKLENTSWEMSNTENGGELIQTLTFTENTMETAIKFDYGDDVIEQSEVVNYTYKGTNLTITDEYGNEESCTAIVNNNTLTISAGDVEMVLYRK